MEESEYCCPRCKSALAVMADSYRCTACNSHYPIVLEIPDFRVFPDPYIDINEDWLKAERIFERASASDFQGLVEYYWSITPDTPREIARRFTAHAIAGVERGRHLLDAHSVVNSKLQQSNTRLLDLGTRTGGVLLAAAERGIETIGIDIAFRWLIVARKRLEEANVSARLICCCAEFLPFRNETFNLVVAENLLEHSAGPDQSITEAYRVLKPGGVFFTTTWNRLALAPEPHVRLWGVGWLPRKLAKSYVKLRKGVNYDHVRLLSIFGLRRMIRRTPFQHCAIILPTFSPAELQNISRLQQSAIKFYHLIRNWPLVRLLLRVFAPVLHLVCIRDSR